jgi:hypothetical protein
VRGMVLRAAAGVCLCLEKCWQPLHDFTSHSTSVELLASRTHGGKL